MLRPYTHVQHYDCNYKGSGNKITRRGKLDSFVKTLSNTLEDRLQTLTNRDDTGRAVEQVDKAVIEAYHMNCPEKTMKQRRHTSWWNKHLEVLRNQVSRLLNTTRYNESTIGRNSVKITLTFYNKEIRQAKRPF